MDFQSNNVTALFFLIVFIVGAVKVFKSLRIIYFYVITIEKWGEAEGLILRSDVINVGPGIDDEWEIITEYSFEVDGIKYVNNSITKNKFVVRQSKSATIKNNVFYERGKRVTVYHNNKNPKESVIDYNLGLGTWSMLALGVFYMFIGFTNLEFL